MSMAVKATDVVGAFVRIQHSIRGADLNLRDEEFNAQNLSASRDQEAQTVQQFNEGLQKSTLELNDLKDKAGRVKKDAWPSVQVQARITAEVKGLEATVLKLTSRVSQLSVAYDLRASVIGLLQAFGGVKKIDELPDLRKQIVTILKDNAQMPIGMLMELHLAKARIDGDLRAAEEQAKKHEQELSSSKSLPVVGNEATYLARMVTVCGNATPPEASVIEAMQVDFDQMPEDLRGAIYAAIAKEAAHADDVLAFGKANLFKDLPRFVKVVSTMPAVQGVFKAEAEKIALLEKQRKAEAEQRELAGKQKLAKTTEVVTPDDQLSVSLASAIKHRKQKHEAQQHRRTLEVRPPVRSVLNASSDVLGSRPKVKRDEQKMSLTSSVLLDAPVSEEEATGPKALLKRLAVLMQDKTLKADKEKRGEALHALFNEMAPREFKLAVYSAIGQQSGRANKAAELYGREHFADSFAIVQKIVVKLASNLD